MQRLLGHLELLADAGDLLTFAQQPVRFSQLLMICSGVCRRRLLCPIAPIVLLAHDWAVRLSQRPDRSQGVMSLTKPRQAAARNFPRSATPAESRMPAKKNLRFNSLAALGAWKV